MQHASRFLPAGLLERAAQIARISSMLRSALPGDLGKHVWFAGIDNQAAQLVTDNACWVAALRFQQQALLESINASSGQPSCTRISIKVAPGGLPLPPLA